MACKAFAQATALLIAAALLIIPARAQTVTVLFNFNAANGISPESSLTYRNGSFYGTTQEGAPGIAGTVFQLYPVGGGWAETVSYGFCANGVPSCPDGAEPIGTPVLFDSAGNLYGLTSQGGNDNCTISSGCGVAFELSPNGSGWTESVLYAFCSGDGYGSCQIGTLFGLNPGSGMVMDSAGNIYGISGSGVFELSPSANGWTARVIYSVAGWGGLVMDAAGNLFGEGTSDYGDNVPIVFELSPNGNGGWTPTVLYSFTFNPNQMQWGGPTLDASGNIYVTVTRYGISNSYPGYVYKLTPGAAGWTEQTIFTFNPDETATQGSVPFGGLAIDSLGNLYGTTAGGGVYEQGTVFELSPPATGNGAYSEKILWNFNGTTDGGNPYSRPVFDDAGNLYGTASSGGSYGFGVFYEVNLSSAPPTSTTLSSAPNPSTFGQAVTFTATVTSSSGTPTGTVNFYDGASHIGSGTLNGSGQTSIASSSLPAGSNSIIAAYQGATNFDTSTSPTLNQIVYCVGKCSTTTNLASSLNPSVYGEPVTFTATVTGTTSVPPTGTVVFQWNDLGETLTLGSATLNASGVATLTKSNLNADTYPVTAVYKGDANNLGSSSAVLNQAVFQTTSAATLTSSPNPSTVGEAVKFTATISSSTVKATGPVIFTAGDTVLGTAQVGWNGEATISTSSLPVGSTAVFATYNGDSNIKGSSASVAQVVQ
jgi:uncharacterized repeat protein (TIGR03803 family)